MGTPKIIAFDDAFEFKVDLSSLYVLIQIWSRSKKTMNTIRWIAVPLVIVGVLLLAIFAQLWLTSAISGPGYSVPWYIDLLTPIGIWLSLWAAEVVAPSNKAKTVLIASMIWLAPDAFKFLMALWSQDPDHMDLLAVFRTTAWGFSDYLRVGTLLSVAAITDKDRSLNPFAKGV